jgi:hypothetical protein
LLLVAIHLLSLSHAPKFSFCDQNGLPSVPHSCNATERRCCCGYSIETPTSSPNFCTVCMQINGFSFVPVLWWNT